MNICFIKGKIISDIEFKFVLNSENYAISMFEIKLSNKSIVKVKAYNDMADYIYRCFKKNDYIFIEGRIECGEIIC